jgi:hypothetical protein
LKAGMMMERSSGCKFICNGAAWIYAASSLPPRCKIISLEKGLVYEERRRRSAKAENCGAYARESTGKMGIVESGIQKR